MSRVLVTGSVQGLGRAAAADLLGDGHLVVVHARDADRAEALADLRERGADVVVGDLADDAGARDVAEQVRALGRVDAVVHNAGVYADDGPHRSRQGHPRTLAVNTLAPYLLTALLPRPDRLVVVTSGMYAAGSPNLADLDWLRRAWDATQAYADSKLYVTTLALALARRWPDVVSSAVDPGWVPTRMGGPHASDDLAEGHRTQVWLAASKDPAARQSGRLWYHGAPIRVSPRAASPAFADRLLDRLAETTGVELPLR